MKYKGRSNTYNSSLQRCIPSENPSDHKNNGWHYGHDNQSKFPLDSERDNVCREKKRDALNECI